MKSACGKKVSRNEKGSLPCLQGTDKKRVTMPTVLSLHCQKRKKSSILINLLMKT